MATNASEHLGLHLWEPTDQVLRTEFNENWQKIDTAVQKLSTPAGLAFHSGSFSMGQTAAAGDALLTLDFAPRAILFSFSGELHLMFSGGSLTIYRGSANRPVRLRLEGNRLVLEEKDAGITYSTSGNYVAWP